MDASAVSKAQLQKLQDETETLRDQKDSTILSMRQEAQEDMQVLRRSMEKAAAERGHEVIALKGNLATLTTELEKWQVTANKYERELDSLQANHQHQNQQRDKVAKQQGTTVIHYYTHHFALNMFKI